MGSDEKEKVAQLQFSESRKKTEPKGSEMTFAPQGRFKSSKSSKHGIMWARRERTHIIQSLAEGAAPTTPNLKNRRKEKEKMKDEKKRTMYLKVRVSPEEMTAIKKKFENSGMSSLSEFVRAMIFEGYIVHINENELKEIHRIANNVANNINQIAHRANITNKVYKEDIEEIKELGDKLWCPLLFLQTKVAHLKH